MNGTRIIFPDPLIGVRGLKRPVHSPPEGPQHEVEANTIDILLETRSKQEEGRKITLDLLKKIDMTMGQVEKLIAARLVDMRDYVLQLAFGLADKVLGTEIDQGRYDLSAPLLEMLQEAVQGLKEGTVTVLLNPEDLSSCISFIEEAGSPEIKRREVRFDVDPEIPRGACRIETSVGQILHDPSTVLTQITEKIGKEV